MKCSKNYSIFDHKQYSYERFLSVEERLALTLRFLANGWAFEDIKFSVTISPSAISQVVIEKCEALMFSRITCR